MVSRRELLAGGGGLVAGGLGLKSGEAAWNWWTSDPEAPEGEITLGDVNNDSVNWKTDVQAGEESVFYQLAVSGPESEDTLVDKGMPKGRSNSHNGDFEPDQPGTYTFSLDAQTDTYDTTLDQKQMTVFGPLEPKESDSEPKSEPDNDPELDYARGDLPFSSIQEGLDLQSNDAYTAVEGAFAEAYFNRDNSVSETAEDAFVEVDDSTAAEYLLADSDERDDMDVYLGFDDGNEGVKMRGSASAGVNEKFEEYMVGLEHLNRLDDEVEDYVQDLADSL